jgi:acyl carrier protein
LVQAEQEASRASAQESNALLDRLKEASTNVREELLEVLVREQLAAILRMDPERIERLAPLRKLGIDSLMSLELRNRLEKVLQIRLSATLVFTHPNLVALVRHLAEQFVVSDEPTAIPQSAEPLPAPEEPLTSEDSTTPMEASDLDEELFQSFDASMHRMRKRRAT